MLHSTYYTIIFSLLLLHSIYLYQAISISHFMLSGSVCVILINFIPIRIIGLLCKDIAILIYIHD